MSLLPTSMKIKSKMKVLEWQQNFSQCKSMVIIPDAQEQLNPQFQVRAGHDCPHNLQRMERMQSQKKAL